MTTQRALTWYERLKRNHIDPALDMISDNLPNIIAVTTAIAAVSIMVKASNDADASIEENKEILKNIENKISMAIEIPSIVKVELGDDLEVIGYGNRVD